MVRLVSFLDGRLLATDGGISAERAALRGYGMLTLDRAGWHIPGQESTLSESKALNWVSKRLQGEGRVLLRGPDYKSMRWFLATVRGQISQEPPAALLPSTDWLWAEAERSQSLARFESQGTLPRLPAMGLLAGRLLLRVLERSNGDGYWFARFPKEYKLKELVEEAAQGRQVKIAAPNRALLEQIVAEVYAAAADVPLMVASSVSMTAPLSI